MLLNVDADDFHTTEALKRLYKGSLYSLAKIKLDYKDVNKFTHKEIIDCLESDSKRKLICVPRGCLKSSIACVAYPIWLLLNNPNLRILINSELYKNSATFIREIKSHIESYEFIQTFGELKGSTWNEGEIILSTRTKFLKEASITAGGISTTKVGQHYDVIICDDLNSPDNTNTHENAEKVIQHFKYLTSILEPEGILVVIGTRYAQNDVIGHILEQENIVI